MDYMIYIRWKRKTELPTAYNIQAKDITKVRRIIIEKKILDNEKVDEVAVFKIAKKTKTQTHIGDMVKRLYITSWVVMDKRGVPKWRDVNFDGTLRRD